MSCAVVGSIELQCQQQQQQPAGAVMQTVDVSDKSARYLSSYVSQQTNCGSFDSPWRLVAPAGRRLRVYLLDFASHDNSAPRHVATAVTCQVSLPLSLSTSASLSLTVCWRSWNLSRNRTLYRTVYCISCEWQRCWVSV